MVIRLPTAITWMLLTAAIYAPAAETQWPSWRGPFSNGSAVDADQALLPDLSAAKRLWVNEVHIPHDYVDNNYKVIGGYASPIIAEDTVYIYWHAGSPEGPMREAEWEKIQQTTKAYPRLLKRAALRGTDGAEAVLKRDFSLLRDDHVLAVDLHTGATRWQRSWTGAGVYVRIDSGHHTMAYGDGRVYAYTASGRLHALDAKTGTDIWSTTLPYGKVVDTYKTKLLAGKKPNRKEDGSYGNQNGCPAFADGVVAITSGSAIFGFDATSGEALWQHAGAVGSKMSVCLAWHPTEGLPCFITNTTTLASCIDAKTGKILWQQAIVERTTPALTPNRMVASGTYHRSRNSTSKPSTGIQCYAIDRRGAKLLWQADPVIAGVQSNAMAIHRNRVFQWTGEHSEAGNNRWVCLDLNSGKILAKSVDSRGKVWGSNTAMNGYFFRGITRGSIQTFPADASVPGWPTDGTNYTTNDEIPHAKACVATTPALWKGLVVLRNELGYLECWDLRRPD